MEVWQQACAALLHVFPTFSTCHFMFTDECTVYLIARSQNDNIWAEQRPCLFEQVVWHLLHVIMSAGVTNELITGPYFFPDVSVTGESYLAILSH
jgi:hypothetical protein